MSQRNPGSATDSELHGPFTGTLDPYYDVNHEPRGDEPRYGRHADLHGHAEAHEDFYLLDDYDSSEVDDGKRHRVERRSADGSRSARHSRTRRRRNRRLMAVVVTLFVVIVAVGAYLIIKPIYNYLHPADYAGTGKGNVLVTVHSDDGAAQIGTELHDHGVVASVRAFTNAAGSNTNSKNIQPGSYRLHKKMSAKSALGLLLDPTTRVNDDVLVPEGATTLDIVGALAAPQCTAKSTSSAKCGPGLSAASVRTALADVKALGVPTEYTVKGKTPASVEGFLFPATYSLPTKTTASDVLQQMVNNFSEQARRTDFTSAAKALRITPYQELIIASIAQAEAKYPGDYPKVARVILNRLTAHKPLQIDATSAYAAKLKGLDPAKVVYSRIDSPYNTYTHSGLPPTPIGNPGVEAMSAVQKPPAANWLFYVNADAQGHLYFTNSETAFAAAVAKCKANHWGCG